MAMGLMPVIGIPLPFLSYGGSFLVASMTMAGLLMNFYANRKEY
jgi:rod shape determining protein RodA